MDGYIDSNFLSSTTTNSNFIINQINNTSKRAIMGLHHQRQPLQEIQEESNTFLLPPHNSIPRVTITTSPITENDDGSNDKLPTLTTPPQTVTRSVSNSGLRSHQQRDIVQDSMDTKSIKSKKLKKSKSTTLLSPAFSSPPVSKAEKSTSLPPPPELPKFVSSNTTTTKPVKASTKKERTQEDIDELNRQVPPPELMPKVIDTSTDFTKKPAYSYAMLIGMSILRAPNRRLTLSQIYNWISDTFKYYKKGDVGWQNSVRHNLSLNKAFVKSAKSKDRKGHFWHIAKGYEYQFYLGKGAANASNGSIIAGKLESFKLNSNNNLTNANDQRLTKSYSDSSFSYQNNVISRISSEEDEDEEDEDDDEDDEDDEEQEDEDGDETVRITMTQTPRSKIIHRQDEDFATTRESSSVLQRYVLHKRSDSQDESLLLPPKKRRLQGSSTMPGQLTPNNIPNLQPPSPYWSASASGDRVIFGLLRTPPKMPTHSHSSMTSHTSQTSSIFDSPIQQQHHSHHHQHHQTAHPSSINQQNRYQQFTSSFSCNSNFDLSPIKGTETGPLLEPLTPGQGLSAGLLTSATTNATSNNINNPTTPSILKTPFNKSSLQTMKTPGSSVMKKIWNSPSYLDDFYTSPVVNRGIHFEEEEVVVSSTRAFGSPSKAKK